MPQCADKPWSASRGTPELGSLQALFGAGRQAVATEAFEVATNTMWNCAVGYKRRKRAIEPCAGPGQHGTSGDGMARGGQTHSAMQEHPSRLPEAVIAKVEHTGNMPQAHAPATHASHPCSAPAEAPPPAGPPVVHWERVGLCRRCCTALVIDPLPFCSAWEHVSMRGLRSLAKRRAEKSATSLLSLIEQEAWSMHHSAGEAAEGSAA